MDRNSMEDLINRVAISFEQERNAQVAQDARQGLLNPAIPHLDFVTREIAAGNITTDFLESSVRIILENAYRFSLIDLAGRKIIRAGEVDDSMKRYCPYLFWG